MRKSILKLIQIIISQLRGYKNSPQKLITSICINNSQLEHIMKEQNLFAVVEKKRNKLNKYLENPNKENFKTLKKKGGGRQEQN